MLNKHTERPWYNPHLQSAGMGSSWNKPQPSTPAWPVMETEDKYSLHVSGWQNSFYSTCSWSLLQSFSCICRSLKILTSSLSRLFGCTLEVLRLVRMCWSCVWNSIHLLGNWLCVNHTEGLLTEIISHVHRYAFQGSFKWCMSPAQQWESSCCYQSTQQACKRLVINDISCFYKY